MSHLLRAPSVLVALFVAAFVATVAPAARAQASPGDLVGGIHERHLDNGLTIIVQEDHRLPLVSLSLRYDFGATAAPSGREGVTALTTFLMVDRSQHVPPGEAARLFARAGASSKGDSTGPLSAMQWATVPAHQLALPLWIWSDQMGFFDTAIDDAAVTSQRTRLLAMCHTALEGQRLGRLDLLANEELFPDDHPYRFSALTPESVERVDRASVIAFHDAWITPDHATLAIVGDVTDADAVALVKRYFGSIPRGPRVARPRFEAPPRLTGETIVDVAANVLQASVSVRWPTPRLLTTEDARLDIVARLFSSRRVAWLVWRVVDTMKVATTVTAHQRSNIAGSQFEVTVEGAHGKTPDELLTALDAAMDEIRALEPKAAVVDGAAYETIIDRLLATERSATRASEYVRYSAFVGTPSYLQHDFERYQDVTPRALHEAIVQWLPRDRRVVLRVTPTPTASLGGDRTGKRFIQARTP